jgi:S-adenosylmethionine:tRNA ribosyltransferase-isomerase
VVRALESAANADGSVRAGDGVASGRIGRETPLRVVDAILTGVHQRGESHFELLRAFADDAVLDQISEVLGQHGYRPHEFGDSILIERHPCIARHYPPHPTADQLTISVLAKAKYIDGVSVKSMSGFLGPLRKCIDK